MNLDARIQELDDWQLVCQLLPTDWQEQARLQGALRRARGFPDAGVLLRTLLVAVPLRKRPPSLTKPVGVPSRRWHCSRGCALLSNGCAGWLTNFGSVI